MDILILGCRNLSVLNGLVFRLHEQRIFRGKLCASHIWIAFSCQQCLSILIYHKRWLSHLEEIIASSFLFPLKAQGVHDCRSFQVLGFC